MPEALTVATAVVKLLQVPPGVASEHVVVEPTHTVAAPEILPTVTAFTVSARVAVALPQVLTTL